MTAVIPVAVLAGVTNGSQHVEHEVRDHLVPSPRPPVRGMLTLSRSDIVDSVSLLLQMHVL